MDQLDLAMSLQAISSSDDRYRLGGTDPADPSAGGTDWPGWSIPLRAVRADSSAGLVGTDARATDIGVHWNQPYKDFMLQPTLAREPKIYSDRTPQNPVQRGEQRPLQALKP
jgi:hypothetical protein